MNISMVIQEEVVVLGNYIYIIKTHCFGEENHTFELNEIF